MLDLEPRDSASADPLACVSRCARALVADAGIAGAGLRATSSVKRSRRVSGEVLWVAGAGAGTGETRRAGGDLTGLRLARVLAAMGDGELDEDPDLVAPAVCRVGSGARACPPEALLHAVVPATHVAITQPDTAMALCAAECGERHVRECFGPAAAWIPYDLAGVQLARALGRAAATPGVRFALLARRGLVTWGETERACHERTVAVDRMLRDRLPAGVRGRFRDGPALAPPADRERLLARLLPVLRGALGSRWPKVVELDTSPQVLDFVCSREAPLLARTGPVCPQQVVHTQRTPLWIDVDPRDDDVGDVAERIVRGARRHRAEVRWEAAAHGGEHPRIDPDARVVLLGGVGMVAAGATRTDARRARQAYRHAIAAMAGAAALDRFVAPSARECRAFARAMR